MIVVVLGGARSGKSELAERRIAALADAVPVTYVATARPSSATPGRATDADAAVGDPDWEARIARHRARRPSHWTTVDAGPDLAALLLATDGPVLLDSLGPWVAGRLDSAIDAPALAAALVDRSGDTVVVSDEVGLAVHPPTAVGRRFTDALGTVNQAVAAVADEAWLVVAGRALALGQEPPWADQGSGRR
jgi:adenosylcobinamide kinase/adenosylcobinamide-phosphate guanylyltransferase